MSDEKPMPDPLQAAPPEVSERYFMDPGVPKNEREWWAYHEIRRLRAEVASAAPPSIICSEGRHDPRCVALQAWMRNHYAMTDGDRAQAAASLDTPEMAAVLARLNAGNLHDAGSDSMRCCGHLASRHTMLGYRTVCADCPQGHAHVIGGPADICTRCTLPLGAVAGSVVLDGSDADRFAHEVCHLRALLDGARTQRDDADAAVKRYAAEFAALEARIDAEADARAAESKEHTEEWYAVRLQLFKDHAKANGWETAYHNIVANGAPSVEAPHTYQQQLNMAKYRAETAEAEVARLKADVPVVEALLRRAWGLLQEAMSPTMTVRHWRYDWRQEAREWVEQHAQHLLSTEDAAPMHAAPAHASATTDRGRP
jgi:hypothetical protein